LVSKGMLNPEPNTKQHQFLLIWFLKWTI